MSCRVVSRRVCVCVAFSEGCRGAILAGITHSHEKSRVWVYNYSLADGCLAGTHQCHVVSVPLQT